MGLKIAPLESNDWRMAAVLRDERLTSPYKPSRSSDRLVLIKACGFFRDVCSLLECRKLPFSLMYGQPILPTLDPPRLRTTLKP